MTGGAALPPLSRNGPPGSRIGGDEFALVLRGCSSEDAAYIAKGLYRAISELRLQWEGREHRIGASIGIAMIDGSIEYVSGIVHAADHACYTAKRQGRSRVLEYCPDSMSQETRH